MPLGLFVCYAMPRPWFRLYAELLNDPKVQRLTGDEFKAWINVLCVASQDELGELPPVEDLAFILRIDETAMKRFMERFMKQGLLDRCESEGFIPHNWKGRQYQSDMSTERVKAYREKKKAAESAKKDGNIDETEVKRFSNGDVTPSDTDTDTDTDTEQNTPYSPPKGTRKKSRAISAGDRVKVERIYQCYPRKVGKAKALEAIRNALDRLTDAGDVVDAAYYLEERTKRFAELTRGADEQFIPHPSTFYNGERYDDDERQWPKIGRDKRPGTTINQIAANRDEWIRQHGGGDDSRSGGGGGTMPGDTNGTTDSRGSALVVR